MNKFLFFILFMSVNPMTSLPENNTAATQPSVLNSQSVDEKTFWQILEKICTIGNFIVATGKDGASANLKGKFNVGWDGHEKVIENSSHDHVHLYPEKIIRFNFTYINAGYGDEPCIEIINVKDEAALRLFYQGGNAPEKYNSIVQSFPDSKTLFSGTW